jgi:hypothetical protein
MLTGLNINGLKDAKTPDDLAQMLLTSGRVNQAQVNQAKQMWEQPNVRQMIQSKFPF